ncbi:hypothetical protein BIV60_12085 [Bacillus sp. MUM 116]|uniref:hypothetical protein n=1 Tax=Bacillus sp. MUM 116 TaxID=1678002 RepID=UPI0008F5EB0E|nr:hypothetical protein [Bacillus sp. MUM 116]OIK14239.1 hypothetical protein BIV60_12085 [Bacillus sp. MUM 116]
MKLSHMKVFHSEGIQGAIAIVFTAMLDDVANTEADISPVTDIVAATSTDIGAIAGGIADLTKTFSDMSSKIERLKTYFICRELDITYRINHEHMIVKE